MITEPAPAKTIGARGGTTLYRPPGRNAVKHLWRQCTDKITSTGDGTHIGLGSGTGNVTLTGGAATVFGGSGAFNILSSVAGGVQIGLAGGSGSVTMAGSNTALFAGTGRVDVLDTGTNDSIGGFLDRSDHMAGSGGGIFSTAAR